MVINKVANVQQIFSTEKTFLSFVTPNDLKSLYYLVNLL